MIAIAKQTNLTDQSLNHLVDLLYKCLEEEISWEPFLVQLNEALGTRVIHMVAQIKRMPPFHSALTPTFR